MEQKYKRPPEGGRRGTSLKRNIIIATISTLAEIGVFAIAMTAGWFLTTAELLVCLVFAGMCAVAAGVLVWMILEENLTENKKALTPVSK